MKLETLPAIEGEHNLANYEEMYRHFDWVETEKQFTWYETGRVNLAYEAIDRHAESSRSDKSDHRTGESARGSRFVRARHPDVGRSRPPAVCDKCSNSRTCLQPVRIGE